jgi:hypothetical protein
MATKDGDAARTVGCGGLLLIPFSTVTVGAELLIAPDRAKRHQLGPYRAMVRGDDQPRPLTPRSMRILGAMLLFWTLLLPAALAVRAIQVYWTIPIGLVASVGLVWLAMFVGHLISMKLFAVIEPRLPHDVA